MDGITLKDQEPVYFAERNRYGAWVVYGHLGVRQYHDSTKKRAVAMYRQEWEREQLPLGKPQSGRNRPD